MILLLYTLAVVAALLLALRSRSGEPVDDPVRAAFARLCLTLAVTWLGFALYLLPGADAARYLHAGAALFVPLALLQVFDTFFERPPSRLRPQLAFLAPLLACLYPAADLLLQGRARGQGVPAMVVGVAVFLGLLLPLRRLWTLHASSESRVDRARLRSMFALTAVAVTFAALEALARALGAVPGSELPFLARSAVIQGAFPPLGAIFAVFLLYFLQQAITVHRLLDLGEIFARIAVVSVAGAVLVAMDTLTVAELAGDYPVHGALQVFVASCLFLLAWEPLRKQLEALVGAVLNRRGRALEGALAELDGALTRVLTVEAFATDLLNALLGSGRVTSATLYLWDDARRAYRLRGEQGAHAEPPLLGVSRASFADAFARGERACSRESVARAAHVGDLGARERLRVMDGMDADLLVPFLSGDVVLGWFGLRDEDDVYAFTDAEVRRLAAAAERASAVLETLQGYEKLKEETRLAALGTMAAGLAHEIRNPLAGIKGAAQYLQAGRDGPDAEMVGVIVDEVDRLDRVVTQFLDYARPLRLQLDPLDARRLVARVMALLEAQASAAGITLTQEHADDLPDVRCDATRMQQVLLNLCQNGLQAMRNGGTLTVRSRVGHLRDPRARDAPALEIAVSDHGVGIAPEDIDKLFVPFWTNRHEGTGLGLAISRRVVLAHGGELDVRSAVGTGSTFTVRLPLRPEDSATDEAAATTRA